VIRIGGLRGSARAAIDAQGEGHCPPSGVVPAESGLLALQEISKTFPGVTALSRVSLDLRRGEVHAVCGENGAGKSTLMKIIGGVCAPTSGRIVVKGIERHFASPLQAEQAGVAMIHQELNLVPDLSVAENIYLAREPRRGFVIDRARLRADAGRCLDRLGGGIDPDRIVRDLPVAQRQMVEIAKALSLEADVLVMDEPTSSLTEQETQRLFAVVRALKASGVGILYISHRLDEMGAIVDRVTVLRDGRHVSTVDFRNTCVDTIVARMVGRSLGDAFPARTSRPADDMILSVAGLSRAGAFADVGFDLRRGEILGFAGLVGAGRTEVARALFGADPAEAGTISLQGRALTIRDPRDAIAAGIAYIPEDRRGQGLATAMPVDANLTLAHMAGVADDLGIIDTAREAEIARRYIDLLRIKTPGLRHPVRLLSGGNQQKIVIGKWLFRAPRLILFDEPTRGIDVGAKHAIYEILDDLAARGVGVILISSELPEILGMTDRVAVFHRGRIVRVLETARTDQEEIMHHASGFGGRA
jgi:ribose transport system ATP-binding protein